MVRHLVSAMAAMALAGTALGQGTVRFSFADPAGGRQLTNAASTLTYDSAAVLSFIVDGSDAGFPSTTFANAGLELRLSVGAAVVNAGVAQAPISGFFRIFNRTNPDSATNTILRGDADVGSFLSIGASSSILFSNPPVGFSLTAGQELLNVLPAGLFLAPLFDSVFTITDILTVGFPRPPVIGPTGSVNNFSANTSFSGTAQLVPTPGAVALMALGGLVAGRRRR